MIEIAILAGLATYFLLNHRTDKFVIALFLAFSQVLNIVLVKQWPELFAGSFVFVYVGIASYLLLAICLYVSNSIYSLVISGILTLCLYLNAVGIIGYLLFLSGILNHAYIAYVTFLESFFTFSSYLYILIIVALDDGRAIKRAATFINRFDKFSSRHNAFEGRI